MASEFITRVEHGKDEPYTVIFTTDDERKYKAIEDACRYAIGHGKPQFQEVVRCKDCIEYRDSVGACHYFNYDPTDEMDFCSHGIRADGERRTDEQQT